MSKKSAGMIGAEMWSSRVGVILAVAGSAVGLGNFLRFPGNVATYGGGAFMIAYVVSFLIIGLPICWAEWTMGRMGGAKGFNSSPSILGAITKNRACKYLGVIGVTVPVIIYMYYVLIEAWCLGYAWNYLTGHFSDLSQEGTDPWMFFQEFIGMQANGSGLGFSMQSVIPFLLLCVFLNFFLIYRGISKGIEKFCQWAMPALVLIALIVLVRVLTLGTPDPENHPERSIVNGLGYMWNPSKVVWEEKNELGEWVLVDQLFGERIEEKRTELAGVSDQRLRDINLSSQLLDPQLWLAAASQIFFSLSIGFGVIITYASYLKKNDDVVLSGLSASAANEFCEVGIGGLLSVPAGVAFLGVAGVAGNLGSSLAMGFNVLPRVFELMPGGFVFGFLFFFLLFLAAVTSSLSMLQPGIAFLEESLTINRRQSVAILGLIGTAGSLFVLYFSEGLKALDTLDFWVGQFLIFVLATTQVIIFAWVIGVKKGVESAHQGATIKIPKIFQMIMQWITPVFLIIIFGWWMITSVFGINFSGENSVSSYVSDLFIEPSVVAQLSVGLIILFMVFCSLLIATSKKMKKI